MATPIRYYQKVIIQQPNKVVMKRSWWERLFSLPWQPWIPKKIIYKNMLKDGQIISSCGALIMNPTTYDDFIKQSKEREK